jgi:hypothetical protein
VSDERTATRFRRGAAAFAIVTIVTASGCRQEPVTPPPSASASSAERSGNRLASWNDGAVKKAIVDFVSRVTVDGGPDFVPPAARIATFDNDGTLWAEQPIYFQVAFAFDRVKALAPQHPEWSQKPPFKAVLEGDAQALAAAGERES